MAATVGSLIARIGLETARFSAGVKRVDSLTKKMQRQFKRRMFQMRRSINNLSAGFTRLFAAVVAVAGPAALGALTVSSLRAIDAQQKFASVIGTTQKELAALQLAASELSGVTDRQTNMALQRMTRRLAEAAMGTGEAKGALKELGVDAAKLSKLDPAKAFRAIGDAIQKVEDPAQQLRLAFKLFDSEGARLVTTLRAGTEVLDAYKEKADALGLSLTAFETAKIEQANDAFATAKKTVEGFGNVIAVEVANIITGLSNMYVDAAVESNNFTGSVKRGIVTAVQGADLIIRSWKSVTLGFKTAAFGMTEIGITVLRVLSFLTSLQAAFPGLLFLKFADDLEQASKALLGASIQAVDANKKLAAEIQGLIAEIAKGGTPIEDLIDKLNRLGDEAARNSQKTRDSFVNNLGEIGDAADSSVQKVTGAFDGFFDSFKAGVETMRQVFSRNLQKMAAEALSSQLLTAFPGLGGGAGVSGFVGSLLGFARGGSFQVGGQPGRDKNVVAFRATQGEEVNISRPGQGGGSGGASVTIVQNNDFSGRGGIDIAAVTSQLDARDEAIKADIMDLMRRRRFTT